MLTTAQPAQRPASAQPVQRPASDLARDTLRQLALRKLAPTPEEYSKVYHELAGTRAEPKAALPAVVTSAGLAPDDAGGTRADWADLMRELLRRWEARSPGWTTARKRESFEQVLARFSGDPEKLHVRLRGLLRSWSLPETAAAVEAELLLPAPSANGAAGGVPSGAVSASPAERTPGSAIEPTLAPADPSVAALRDLIAQLVMHAASGEKPGSLIGREAASLIDRLSRVTRHEELVHEAQSARPLLLQLEMGGSGKAAREAGLLSLVRLIVSNIEELVPDERWMKGQVTRLRDVLEGPMDPAAVGEAEKTLRDVIVKQSNLKREIAQSQQVLKDMLGGFIERLGKISDATTSYTSRIDGYTERIKAARDLPELSGVVSDLVAQTQLLGADVQRSRDDLESAQKRALDYEAKVRALEGELEHVSSLARRDTLTGALNRRGMDEILAAEFARSRRSGQALSVALLDVDHFKRLNDTLGHAVGDDVLRHLTEIVRESVRPTDSVARFGGEEFAVIFPATGLEEADVAMVRVQRLLTRKFFLHNNERVLITFSAGVAQWHDGESAAELFARADAALYEGKRAGRNRVCRAPDPVLLAAPVSGTV